MRFDLSRPGIQRHLYLQSGLLRRAQLLAGGAAPHDIERWVRRRELTVLRAGLYVDHTGPLTPLQRQWAAVLAVWPAALAGESALDWPRRGGLLVAVDAARTPRALRGTEVVRMRHFDETVFWSSAPPRVLSQHAVLAVAADRLARQDAAAAYAALAQARGDGLVCVDRMQAALAATSRLHGRALLRDMLDDLAAGSHSVLERGYLQLVHRPHGLPPLRRQVRSVASGRPTYQDLRYDPYGTIVELDGLTHATARARDSDAGRDLAELAASDAQTVRLTYGQVYRSGCVTAQRLAAVLRRRGWTGRFRRCPLCP